MDQPNFPGLVLAERMQWSLPSKPHWIESAVEYLRQKAILSGVCSESRATKLTMALHEALSNSIIHGNLELTSDLRERDDDAFAEALAQRSSDPVLASRSVDVVFDYDGNEAHWIMTDQGQGFNVEDVLARSQSEDPEKMLASGRGLLIMRSFMDDVRWELGGRRVILTMKKISGMEKRQVSRQPTLQPLRVAPILPDGTVDWAAAYEAVARDYSLEGIGLIQERISTSDRILIGVKSGEQMVYLPAEIRHCRSTEGDLVEIGCRFQARPEPPKGLLAVPTQTPKDEELAVGAAVASLLKRQRADALPTDERRSHQRVVYSDRIEILAPILLEPILGYARDLSRSGVSFITTKALPKAVILIFQPPGGGPKLRIRSHVVRCGKVKEGFYDIGARFIRLVEHHEK